MAAVIATFVGWPQAYASTTTMTAAKGISIPVGMTQPISDPLYEYVFDVQLLAGSTLSNGGFFTIYDLPDIGMGADRRA